LPFNIFIIGSVLLQFLYDGLIWKVKRLEVVRRWAEPIRFRAHHDDADGRNS